MPTVTKTLAFTSNAEGIPDAKVSVFADENLLSFITTGRTDNFGNVTFYLDPGTYYFVTTKAGYSFTNPDIEVVS